MALLDAYATTAEFKARTSHAGSADDTEIGLMLLAGARLLDRELGVADGSFNLSPTGEARLFTPGYDDQSLSLRDEYGRQHLISTVDSNGIAVDEDQDGTYETQFDPTAENWCKMLPANAAATSEPWTSVLLLALSTNTVMLKWPKKPLAVQVTGTWGWAAVPDIILELNVKLTRDMFDSIQAGAAGDLATLDGSTPLKADTWRLWHSAKLQYSHRIPAVA